MLRGTPVSPVLQKPAEACIHASVDLIYGISIVSVSVQFNRNVNFPHPAQSLKSSPSNNTLNPYLMAEPHTQIHSSHKDVHYLLLLNDVDSGFDIGEGMHCGQDSIPLVLFTQIPPGASIHGERGGVHETPEAEVLLKVGHPVFHLILIEIGLHKCNLYVGLEEREGRIFVLMPRQINGTQEISRSLTVSWHVLDEHTGYGLFIINLLSHTAGPL